MPRSQTAPAQELPLPVYTCKNAQCKRGGWVGEHAASRTTRDHLSHATCHKLTSSLRLAPLFLLLSSSSSPLTASMATGHHSGQKVGRSLW